MGYAWSGKQALKDSHDNDKSALRVVDISAPVNVAWDYLAVTYPTSTQEVYTFKTGGSGGTTVKTITVNYTTTAKDFISNVAVT